MKKSLFVMLSAIALIAFSACKQKSSTNEEVTVLYDTVAVTSILIAPEYYFAGNFSYKADAANLQEAATGSYLPVAMEEQYPKLERQYMELEKNGQPVYVELRGYLKPKEEDEEGVANKLVVTQIMTISDAEKVEKNKIVTGTYKSEDETLIVNSDHTYTLSSKEGETKDHWYLSADNIFVLVQADGHVIMDIDYPEQQLKTREEQFTLYTRE